MNSKSPSKNHNADNDNEDTKTEIYLEDLQHLVNDAKNMMNEPS